MKDKIKIHFLEHNEIKLYLKEEIEKILNKKIDFLNVTYNSKNNLYFVDLNDIQEEYILIYKDKVKYVSNNHVLTEDEIKLISNLFY